MTCSQYSLVMVCIGTFRTYPIVTYPRSRNKSVPGVGADVRAFSGSAALPGEAFRCVQAFAPGQKGLASLTDFGTCLGAIFIGVTALAN
jgi:hypothetical protein